MYDRAPRQVSDQLVGSTSSNVGPGTYELPNKSKKESSNTGYAPFLSLAGRSTIFNVPEKEIDDPGPGTYNPSLPQPHVKGGGTLANKERRFTDTELIKENTPGPGRYNLKTQFHKTLENEETLQLATKKTKTVALDGGESMTVDVSITKGGRPMKILTASLKSDINCAAVPSIPSPGQAHGFVEKTQGLGSLVKQKGPTLDKSMGPAYYNPNHEETKATKKYKGVHFGTMTSNRTQFKGKNGPAPCDYNTLLAQTWNSTDKDKIGSADENKIFESRLPRYHQIVQIEEKKRGVPGPGRYSISSQFQDGYMSDKKMESLKKRPAFGCSKLRFLDADKKTPSPGSYNDPRNALEVLKKISGLKRSPFGQTAIRFKNERSRSVVLNNTPGPGSYNILNYGMSADSIKRAKKASKHGGFGSSSVRTKSMIERDAKDTPGPGLYELRNTFKNLRCDTAPGTTTDTQQQQGSEVYKNQQTSSFASHTARLDAPTTRTKLENPPPGSYEVAFAYEKTQSKGGQNSKPRNKQAYLRQRSFLSSAPRFGKMNVYMPGQLPVDPEICVSAASYTPKPENNNATKLALIACKDDRFKDIKNTTPGPGTYHLSPLIDSTVLKGTYNVTLNNPVPSKNKRRVAGITNQPPSSARGSRPHTTAAVVAVN